MSERTVEEAKAEIQAIVVVSQVVSKPVKDVWQVLMADSGAEALLGKGGRLGDKGHPWRSDDGRNGVTRSFHPMSQIRFTWRQRDDEEEKASMVKLEIQSAGDNGTLLELTHSSLPADADHQFLIDHWKKALNTIANEAVGK